MKPITITLKPSMAWGIGIILALLTYAYSTGSVACQDGIKFFLGATGAASAFLAAYFAGKAMNRSIKATEGSAEIEKMRLSYQILQTIDQSMSPETKTLISKEIDDDSTQDTGNSDQYYRIKKDTALNQAVIHLLGAFEDMAIAIKHDIADEGFLKDSMIVMIETYFLGFRGYITGLRNDRKKQILYCELENLYNSWNKTS
jgi:hypothetical protein